MASKKMGPLLLQAGLLTEKELVQSQEAARRRRVSLLDVLLEEKRVSEESLADTLAQWLKLPRVRLASLTVEPEALKVVSQEMAGKHTCLPVKLEGKALVLAMANPADFEAIQEIEFSTGLSIRPVVASRTEILDGIETHYEPEGQLQDFLANVSEASEFNILEGGEGEDGALDTEASRTAAEQAPVVKMCNLIIQDAIRAGASDIHVEPELNDIRVRFRIDGVLRDYMQIPKWLHMPLVSRVKILSKLDIAERRLPQDGRIKVQQQNKSLDLRVSTLPTHFGEKVVMRLLGSSKVPDLPGMGFTESQIAIVDAALNQPQGLILTTGPTGSGKSTTLYSMLNKRKSPEVNIITVEDPIEYQIAGINQVQVNVKAGLTFASCLRSILRQDPDVILVGEIRDLETAEIAFHAAMTGHLVLSTLHTNSSLATIARLLDLGVDPFLVSSSVTLIMAQRLARRVCQRCKEIYTPSSGLLERLHIDEPTINFYRGKGCPACGNTGYAGRIGLYELLRLTPTIKELINRKAPEVEMRKAAGLAGTRFLLEDAMEKVRQGITTLEEVLRVIQLQEEEITRCPKCNSFINLDFSTCPYCMHALKYLCESCGQELKLEWKICPYCNTRVERTPTAEGALRALPPGASLGPGPRATAAALPAAPEGTSALPPGRPMPKKPRILVVDDDEGIKKVLQKSLQQLPMETEVLTASDGEEALKAAEKHLPDLVISDVMMPHMDGITLCQKLREGFQTAFIPIMMLTASADEANRTKAYMVGTDDYVTKPFTIPDLNARVMRLLRRTYGL
ncbi:MAG: Flp pilus assembly complex ATPase component TadA [Acidobacteria bacterium]|nr:Flp pilus assembly complex ATPase component TadA [Acidobacteriota bacterium]